MPIYAYRCELCDYEEEVLQKLADAPLTRCPACGQSAFRKQVTAAGFQLKGSGWYVTDFRNTAQVAGGEKEKKKNDASATIGDKPRGDTSAGAAPTNAKAAGKPA